MSNTIFRFKKFSVQQENCSMKIGTDGILLGAWTDCSASKTIIDIGTGTGILALMMAQKNPVAQIEAIEIDKDSFQQASDNFMASDWSRRINPFNLPIQQFTPGHLYDLIITNPPFFINSLPSPNERRTISRHTDCMDSETIIDFSLTWMRPEGRLSLILPVNEGQDFIRKARIRGLYPERITQVKPSIEKPAHRYLLRLAKTVHETVHDEIVIENGIRHHYTDEYKALTRDFYLYFRDEEKNILKIDNNL